MSKNKEDVIKLLQKIKNKDYDFYRHIKHENQCYPNKELIQHNCINNKCPNHAYIEFDGINWHLCCDNWSGKYCAGWHIIYCETLDLCAKRFE